MTPDIESLLTYIAGTRPRKQPEMVRINKPQSKSRENGFPRLPISLRMNGNFPQEIIDAERNRTNSGFP
jgi:hypothetical protein